LRGKFHGEILMGSFPAGCQTRKGCEKQAISSFKRQHVENGSSYY